jgi:Ca2+/Na+ antiporter
MSVAGKYLVLILLVFGLVVVTGKSQAQTLKVENDTTVVDSSKLHSPKLATIMSAVVPGLGQVYNKKYWKVPVVYAGFGIIGYSIYKSSKNYNQFLTAYTYRNDNDPTTIDTVFTQYRNEDIIIAKDYYRRNRDLSYIIGVLWYVINIVDATVDAHLFYFNLSDDLSFSVKPSLLPSNSSIYSAVPCVSLNIGFGKDHPNKINHLKLYP